MCIKHVYTLDSEIEVGERECATLRESTDGIIWRIHATDRTFKSNRGALMGVLVDGGGRWWTGHDGRNVVRCGRARQLLRGARTTKGR